VLGIARGAESRPSDWCEWGRKKFGENVSQIVSRSASLMLTILPPPRSCEQDSNIAGDRVIRFTFFCACVHVIWVRGESAYASLQEKSGSLSTTGGWSLRHLGPPKTVSSWRRSTGVASPARAAVETASMT
jgi:hypothetical protein